MYIAVPYHISGFWIPKIFDNPLVSGSLGAGIVLESCIEYSTESGLRQRYGLGEGYGASAAIALVEEIRRAIELGRGLLEAAQKAHIREVLAKTGLGDVIAEFQGSYLVTRLRSGAPGIGVVEVHPTKRYYVITAVLGAMDTKTMLEQYWQRIVTCGIDVYRRYLEKPCIETFLENAYRFSTCVGFIDRDFDQKLREVLRKPIADGTVLNYFVKKRLLVIVAEEPQDVVYLLRTGLGLDIRVDRIGFRGTVVKL